MFWLNCIKLFLSLNGKTSQQTKHSSLAIAKFSMMRGTCNVFVQYKICTMQKTWTKPQIFHHKFFLFSKTIETRRQVEKRRRILQGYFQPKIGRKIGIFSLGRKNNIPIKKKECRSAIRVVHGYRRGQF